MVEHTEAALTRARILELYERPVQGDFDVAHLREVHRRIFQDLPHYGPGEFRPDAPGHFKHRNLEYSKATVLVPYALRPETDRMLGPTLDALKGGKALQGFDMLEMSEALAQTYARLDYLHPFAEGNSRTLRTFTEQLARETGHDLDWGTTNANAKTRDALYIARDMAVIGIRNPGLSERDVQAAADAGDRDDYHLKYQLVRQIEQYHLADPLQEIVRRSLEDGRDAAPYNRCLNIREAAREIGVVAPIALNQADRGVEDMRLAVLRRTASPADYDKAVNLRDWVAQQGGAKAMTDRLEQVASGHITINHDPGVPAIDRLGAISDGINRELTQRRAIETPAFAQPTVAPPTRDLGRDIER